MLGINNRDLSDFSVDIERTYALLADVPAGKTVVSESGFSTRDQLDELERVGIDAVLIGETLMRAPDIEAACRELHGRRLGFGPNQVKVLRPSHAAPRTPSSRSSTAPGHSGSSCGRRRRVFARPGVAAGIARAVRRQVETVGVFVNQPLDEIAGLVDALGVTHVQLHGDEGPSFCAAVAQRTGAKVIKAVRVGHASDLQDVERFHTDLHLLDTAAAGQYGGTGRTWDWSLLAQRRAKVPFLLSGGLTPDNVADGIAAARPWGVDVASGVEAAPGVKDPDKLEAFFTRSNPATLAQRASRWEKLARGAVSRVRGRCNRERR